MGSACTTESRSPSPVYGRNGVILKRPASITSYELKLEKMQAEVDQVKCNILKHAHKNLNKLFRPKPNKELLRI